MVKIKNLKISSCVLASGSLGWFGDGYFYDVIYRLIIFGFRIIDRTTFVAKTTTLVKNLGNMLWKVNFKPKELMPTCIKIFRNKMLNAVGLSGPGASALFDAGLGQDIDRTFGLSFMAIGKDLDTRLGEASLYVQLVLERMKYFSAPFWQQVNISCPNVKHNTAELAKEAIELLKIFSPLRQAGIVIDLKINVLMSDETVKEIEGSSLCDILTISNTIPFGTPGLGIDWNKLFKNGKSPLAHLGGGGLSGAPILPVVLRRISELRKSGVKMFIKGSGGILHWTDVDRMKDAGADAIEIATALAIRPWRVKSIIERAEEIF